MCILPSLPVTPAKPGSSISLLKLVFALFVTLPPRKSSVHLHVIGVLGAFILNAATTIKSAVPARCEAPDALGQNIKVLPSLNYIFSKPVQI
jgi:hypothetical protein